MKNGPLDFATVPLLHARPRPDDWRRWLDCAHFPDIPVQGGSSFESLSLTIEAAATGMGVAIAIEGLLALDLARGNLVRAHPAVRPTRRQFVLEYEQRMAEDPALVAFVAWLTQRARPAGAEEACRKEDGGEGAPRICALSFTQDVFRKVRSPA